MFLTVYILFGHYEFIKKVFISFNNRIERTHQFEKSNIKLECL